MSVFNRSGLIASLAIVAFAASVAPSNSYGQEKMMMKHNGSMEAKVGLDGYCPVCVVMKKVWEKGDPNISSTFDGVTYYFPGESIKAAFDANPEKFVPALNGDCIVCYEKLGKRVPGSVQHPALYNGRLYLFPSDREKEAFQANPAAFANTDLAAKGECVVCLAKIGKHVSGSPDHTVIHDGLRYQFPSENEANAFRQSPAQFVSKVSTMSDVGVKANDSSVCLVGRSGCAGCEFGVTPISAPEELGLAVVGNDGSVTVVENAHRNYPQIYKDRFQGQRLTVEGKVVKTQGKIKWIEPTSLMVVN